VIRCCEIISVISILLHHSAVDSCPMTVGFYIGATTTCN